MLDKEKVLRILDGIGCEYDADGIPIPSCEIRLSLIRRELKAFLNNVKGGEFDVKNTMNMPRFKQKVHEEYNYIAKLESAVKELRGDVYKPEFIEVSTGHENNTKVVRADMIFSISAWPDQGMTIIQSSGGSMVECADSYEEVVRKMRESSCG